MQTAAVKCNDAAKVTPWCSSASVAKPQDLLKLTLSCTVLKMGTKLSLEFYPNIYQNDAMLFNLKMTNLKTLLQPNQRKQRAAQCILSLLFSLSLSNLLLTAALPASHSSSALPLPQSLAKRLRIGRHPTT
jgi:hypothetical protein